METSTASRSDRVFASLVSGGWGAAAVALVFLVVDTVRGDPFYTPSLMGSVAFLGALPAEVAEVRVDLMAPFTVIHFLLFTVVGFVATQTYDRYAGPVGHPVALAAGLFVALTLGATSASLLVVPGLLASLGVGAVLVANAAASAAMATLIHRTLRGVVVSRVLARATGSA